MPDPSLSCDLHLSSWQNRILNSLNVARDQTCILMDTSWVHDRLSHNRNANAVILNKTEISLFLSASLHEKDDVYKTLLP